MAFELGALVGQIILDDEWSGPLTKATNATSKSINTLQAKAKELQNQLNKAPIGSKQFKDLARELASVNKELAKANSLSKGGSGIFSASSMANLAKSLPIVGLGLAGIATGLGAIAKSALMAGAELQQMKIAFGTFLGSEGAAEEVVKQLNEFANVTPFTNDQALQAGKAWLAFGGEVEKLIPTLTAVGDVAAGTGKDFNQLAIIYSKAMTEGVIQNDTLNQLAEAGVPIIKEFAKQFGVAESSIRKMSEDGLIRFEHLEEAFQSMTGEGGQFFNLMEKQSKSFSGLLSTIEGQTQSFLATIGEGAAKGLTPMLEDLALSKDEMKEMTKTAERWAYQVEKAALSFSDLFKDVKQPFSEISNMMGDMGKDISLLNAGMFIFAAVIRLSFAPMKLLVDGFKLIKSLVESLGEKDFAKFERAIEDVAWSWDDQMMRQQLAFDRIWEAKKPIEIEIEIPDHSKDKIKTDSGEAGKKAGKEAAFEWADSFQRAMKDNPVGFAGPAMSKIGDIGAGAITKTPKLPDGSKYWEDMLETAEKAINRIQSLFGQLSSAWLTNLETMASAQLQKFDQMGEVTDLLSTLSMDAVRKQTDAEVQAISNAEDAKIAELRRGANERLAILDEEFRKAKELKDQEFATFIEQERIRFEMKMMQLDAEAADDEQRKINRAVMEENWLQYMEQLRTQHEESVSELQKTSNQKTEEEKKKSDETIVQAEENKQSKIEAAKRRGAEQEKKIAKQTAFINYILQVAGLEVSKSVQRAQARVTLAMSLMSAMQGAIQLAAMAPPFTIPLGIALGATLSGLALSTYMSSMGQINSAFVMPPAELFMAQGGAIAGPSHAAGGVPIRGEGGEFMIDKTRTERMFNAIDSGSMGGTVIHFNQGAIVVQGSLDQNSIQPLAEAISDYIARKTERRRIG